MGQSQATVPHVARAVALGEYVGLWTVGTKSDISSQAQVNLTIARDTRILRITSESDIQVNIDTGSATAIGANDRPYLEGMHEIPIPKGLLAAEGLSDVVIYVHIKQVTSVATKSLWSVQS